MSDTLKIGPVSGGDRKTMAALADSLGLPHFDEGDCIVIGPASEGDRKQVAAKAQALGLGVADYVAPELPETPVEPEEPETPEEPQEPQTPVGRTFVAAGLTDAQYEVLESLAVLFGAVVEK